MLYWKSLISASYASLLKDIQGNRTWPKPTNLNGSVPRPIWKVERQKWRLSLPHSNHGRPLGDSEDNLCHISIMRVVDDFGFRIPNLQTDASRGWNPVRMIWKNQLENSWFVGGFSMIFCLAWVLFSCLCWRKPLSVAFQLLDDRTSVRSDDGQNWVDVIYSVWLYFGTAATQTIDLP